MNTSELPADATAFARLPILDGRRTIAGYELVDRSGTPASPARDAQMLVHALALSGQGASAGRMLLVRCQLETLLGEHLDLIDPAQVALEPILPEAIDADAIAAAAQTMETLRHRGFRLVLPHEALGAPWRAWLLQATHMKIDLSRLPLPALPALVKAARRHEGLQLMACGVDTPEQHVNAAQLGLVLFQGAWFAAPVLNKDQTLRPSQAVVLELIGLLRKGADLPFLEEVLKRDPALSVNLLRFINSSAFGLRAEVTSFRHAVMILGHDKLLRWCCLLLATARDGASPAVGQTAVVRGRLMELLAEELLSPDQCDHAFVVGVFSLLDAMTGVSLERALDGLPLPAVVLSTLLRRQSGLAPFLELTVACERADDDTFARAANQLGLSNYQVNMAHLQALAWAEELLAT